MAENYALALNNLEPQFSVPSIEERMCWICLSNKEYSELDNTDQLNLKDYESWIYPCKCRGTQAWVHQACLRRWIDMQQGGDLMKKVKCSQCKYVYHFRKPPAGQIIKIGRRLVECSQTVSMLSTGLTFAGSALYCVSGIGCIIATRVCGQKNIVRVSRQYPKLSFISFTAIVPSLLLSRRMFQWETPVLKLVARLTENTKEEYECTVRRIERTLAPTFNSSRPRWFFGAISTPFLGSYIGEKLFSNTENTIGSHVLRCLAGSAIFISAKMVLKTLYLYQQNEMHKNSRISNYKRKSKRNAHQTSTSQTMARFAFPTF